MRSFTAALFFLVLTLALQAVPAHAMSASDQDEAESLISTLQTLPNDLATRLEYASRYFLGRPYLVGGPLGEGANAEYDQDALFRMDGFDCTTFVETTTALARSHDFNDFMNELMHLRYLNGNISFTTRNHFVELDWNPNNIAAGFFSDFSNSVGSVRDRAIAVQSFSKKEWYEGLKASALHIDGASPELLANRLDQLHHEGDAFADITSSLPYVRTASLPKAAVKASLPTPAVLNIIHDVAGTPPTRMVTHQILLLNVNGVLRVRQASSKLTNMKVIDSTYDEYVASLQSSPSTKGFNILRFLPRNVNELR